MTALKQRSLILVHDPVEPQLETGLAALEADGHIVYRLDYGRLMDYEQSLRDLLDQHGINIIIFGRNDQVYDEVNIGPLIRALNVGYSTFSGIDQSAVLEQTITCLNDLVHGPVSLEFPPVKAPTYPAPQTENTYSLIFDMEQLAGVRYGLPRLLDLLDQYDAKATFFVTNFVHGIYENAVKEVTNRGHEVGLHGMIHEYLDGHSAEEQTAMIREMIADFGDAAEIKAGNFIYRMDPATAEAMVAAGLNYFVVFMQHLYTPFSYRRLRVRPYQVWTPAGNTWMMPIPVETYDRPWPVIRNMLGSAIDGQHADHWRHISVLMHPFRDGTLRNITDLERLLKYMNRRGYSSVTINSVVEHMIPPMVTPSCYLYMGIPDSEMPSGPESRLWAKQVYYEERIGNLYDALHNSGRESIVCFELPPSGDVFAAAPYLPDAEYDEVYNDPLFWKESPPMPDEGNHRIKAYLPAPFDLTLMAAFRALRPKNWRDFSGLWPETFQRIRYRLREMKAKL